MSKQAKFLHELNNIISDVAPGKFKGVLLTTWTYDNLYIYASVIDQQFDIIDLNDDGQLLCGRAESVLGALANLQEIVKDCLAERELTKEKKTIVLDGIKYDLTRSKD